MSNLAPIRDGYEDYKPWIEEVAADSIWAQKEHLYDALKEAQARGAAFLKITWEDGEFCIRKIGDEF